MRGKNSIDSLENKVRIGVDLMGSDTSPTALLESLLSVYKDAPLPFSLVLIGREDVFQGFSPTSRISFALAKEVITMEDDPLSAVRLKKGSSLCLGMQMLQKKEISAFISSGNTGALIASAMLSLPMLPGIDRPALLTLLPTKRKEMAVLDVGANITYKTYHLIQFAMMGIAFQKSRDVANPVVGLLNIGAEEKKGTPELREAYQKLQKLNQKGGNPIFIGNIEGKDVFNGNIDVLVTDGFTGNVFLKTSEGTAAFILEELQEHFVHDCPPALSKSFSAIRQRLHYAEYPGAILCGIDGIVVKCHGDSSPQAVVKSIDSSFQLIHHSFLEKIKAQLSFDY